MFFLMNLHEAIGFENLLFRLRDCVGLTINSAHTGAIFPNKQLCVNMQTIVLSVLIEVLKLCVLSEL